MTRTLLILIAGALALVAGPASSQSALDDAAKRKLEEASDATASLRLEESERLLAQLGRTIPDSPNLLFELSRLRFHQGRYAEALNLADRALKGASDTRTTRSWRGFRELCDETLAVTREYATQASPDGRYVVLYPDGKDRYLASYALGVLEKADDALAAAFGVRLPGPIRLEIYPSPETLARVSALTVEQIETTGTVALSKWNRLMITSPKALVRGYPWADTITHELVHMVLSRITGERAPVWLQEGTAKLFERSWRSPDKLLVLDAPSRELLRKAKSTGALLTFEQMHPSIAMLPSQDDAALAFAQVSTFMDRYVQRFGRSALQAGLSQVADGVDAREALSAAAGAPFSNIEADWKSTLPSAAATEPGVRRLQRRFVAGDGPTDESQEVVADAARRFMRLGDLLWDRGRAKAASIEYKKAHEADPDDPIVAARWARAALDTGDAQGAVTSLAPQVERYPGHAPTHSVLGAAYLMLGDRISAQRELWEAIWLNPFDPDPHCALAAALPDGAEAERERAVCSGLRDG